MASNPEHYLYADFSPGEKIFRDILNTGEIPSGWEQVSGSQNYRRVFRMKSGSELSYIYFWDDQFLPQGPSTYDKYGNAFAEARFEAEALSEQLKLQGRIDEAKKIKIYINRDSHMAGKQRGMVVCPDMGSKHDEALFDWMRNGISKRNRPISSKDFNSFMSNILNSSMMHPDLGPFNVVRKKQKGKLYLTAIDNTMKFLLNYMVGSDFYDQYAHFELFRRDLDRFVQSKISEMEDLNDPFLSRYLKARRDIDWSGVRNATIEKMVLIVQEQMYDYDELPEVMKKTLSRHVWEQDLKHELSNAVGVAMETCIQKGEYGNMRNFGMKTYYRSTNGRYYILEGDDDYYLLLGGRRNTKKQERLEKVLGGSDGYASTFNYDVIRISRKLTEDDMEIISRVLKSENEKKRRFDWFDL